MIQYTLHNTHVVKFDGTYTTVIPLNNGTAEWYKYLDWVAEGNVPNSPDPLPPPDDRPTFEERIAAAETLINLILDEEDV